MPGLTTVETVCVDREATGYATFQSHNQKVVSNRNGLFMAYLRSRNEAYTAQQWRLVRSTDGGKHWTTLYEATHATNPPALETDAQGNLYLVRPDFLDGHAYLYRFHAASGYREPLVSRIANGAAGKFALCLDPIRRQLYYFAHNDTFHVVGLDGSVRRSYRILQPGTHAILQYPHLSLDRDGTLYAAWTTQKHGVYLYWDIHYMRSRDGGQSWQKLDGTSLSLPVVADNTGPAEGIIREDEYPVHTWLSSFLVRAGKLHFVYQAWTQPARQYYLRYDLATGQREVEHSPEWGGETIRVAGLDGFLASSAAAPNAPLYVVHNQNGRIACLVSHDHGVTWRDHALSRQRFGPYAISGCREITADGYLIGAFTDRGASTDDILARCPVYFIKIRTHLSGAGPAAEAGQR
ncbi:MAG: hypothetical protein GX774_10300 [Armatimonadetes bacterium]|nr:hypothetical protein [Armatimonadota bacterium]